MDNKFHEKSEIEKYKTSPAKRMVANIKRQRTKAINKIKSQIVSSESYLLQEAANTYKRKYQCPFCDERYERLKLISHIEKKHPECISEEFTATRIVFNLINKKEKGKCVICGKESPWNEDKGRYDRTCSDKCTKEYIKIANERTKRIYGKTKEELLKDPEYQNNKMLANRKISGTYKFQDGTTRSYVGSYEKKFLEFMDIFLNIKSIDLETPGPIIEYTYKGKKHKWITDAYYAPYNLVFDIKDGGDNPNNRNMPDYRAKQEAKENAIKKQGKYNYIRLTDNKFEQLIELMLELKELYLDNNEYTPIVRINESYIDDDTEVLNEGVIIKNLYHGDAEKYDILKPVSPDLGNALQKPGWSLFCWKDKEKAKSWAIFRSIGKLKKTNRDKYNFHTAYNPIKCKTFINKSGLDDLLKAIQENEVYAYLYTIKVPFYKIGLGNDSSHDEYTYREEIKPQKIEKIKINKSMIMDYLDVVTDKYYEDNVKGAVSTKYMNNRNILQCLLLTKDYSYNFNTNKDVIYALYFDDLNPGDNIEEYLSNKGLKINKLNPIDRLSMIFNKNVSESYIIDEIYDEGDNNEMITENNKVPNIDHNNNGNPAVRNARNAQIEWEKKNGYDPDEDWSKRESSLLESSSKHLYFYHIVDNDADMSNGLISPEYMYHHGMINMFLENTDKYRYRLCNSWNIYPGRDPESLTADEIYNGLKKFRGKYGNSYIYFFRFPPYRTLDKAFKNLYKSKTLYKIDLNDPRLKSLIVDIFYGNMNSNSDNDSLDRDYYQNITPDEYFGNFDPKNPMLFSTLNHIAIATKSGAIPLKLLTHVDVPDTITDINEISIIKYCDKEPSKDGFMNNGTWNSVIKFNGESYRERVECIIFNKELDKVLISVDGDKVELPGGGTEKDRTFEDQVIEECKQEVRVNINNIKYIDYYIKPDKDSNKFPDIGTYKGIYNYLYFATCDSKYDGYIRDEDKDSMIKTAKFYPIEEAINLLGKYNPNIQRLFIENYNKYINSRLENI